MNMQETLDSEGWIVSLGINSYWKAIVLFGDYRWCVDFYDDWRKIKKIRNKLKCMGYVANKEYQKKERRKQFEALQ